VTDPSAPSAAAFAEIARHLFKAPSLKEAFQRLVDVSVRTVRPCDAAAISFRQGDEVVTPVWSTPAALELDKQQYEAGEGPCLDVLVKETTVYAQNVSEDPRWPRFGPLAAAAGMHSVLSVKLGTDEAMGALNLYAKAPAAYGDEDLAKSDLIAKHAAVALEARAALDQATGALEAERDRVQKLQTALKSRDVIGQAKGVLMHRHRITSERAFSELREVSQRLNIKLRDIAQRVVDTGEMPRSAF
jgi:GAF domain-containing protein